MPANLIIIPLYLYFQLFWICFFYEVKLCIPFSLYYSLIDFLLNFALFFWTSSSYFSLHPNVSQALLYANSSILFTNKNKYWIKKLKKVRINFFKIDFIPLFIITLCLFLAPCIYLIFNLIKLLNLFHKFRWILKGFQEI